MAPADDDGASPTAELLQLLGIRDSQTLDLSATLSASDLRSLMQRAHLRSQQINARVRHCLISQGHEFRRIIDRASSSLSSFSEIAGVLQPLLDEASDATPDLLALSSQLLTLIEAARQGNAELAGKRDALSIVKKISILHEELSNVGERILKGDIVDAAESLRKASFRLGIPKGFAPEDDDGSAIKEEIKPYKLLREMWTSRYTLMSDHAKELFQKTIVIDSDNGKLYIGDQAQVSTLLTAMNKIDLLGKTFAKFADAIWKTAFTFILQQHENVDLVEEKVGNAMTMQWRSGSKFQGNTTLAFLYTNLLRILKFLHVYLCCTTDTWMRELGRFLWPRMAEAIISSYLSKAVPSEVSEVAQFQEYTILTNDFEKAVNNIGLFPELTAEGERLGKFVSDVELHFASKKRDRIMARTRRLLVRADFNIFSGKHSSEDFENVEKNKQNKVELFFQQESCFISSAAKQLMEIVHGVLEDACVAGSRVSVELYHTARDALLLYSAVVPVKLSKELKNISSEAIVHHNDCLYLAHESLGVRNKYWDAFPAELRETCIFMSLFPFFQEMAADVLKQQIELISCNINQALDQANGFNNTSNVHVYEMAMLAIQQVVFHLEKVRMIWQPIMIQSTYVNSMARLLALALERVTDEILLQDDIDVRETEQLQRIIFYLEDQLLPLFQSLVVDLPKENTASSSSLQQIGRLVPAWCKLLRLAELLDMSLVSITEAWETGNLSVCGFSSIEVQKIIKATFADTDLRKECLKKVAENKVA